MLHPRRSAQHVLLCDSCETAPLQSHCERCNINLCTNCVEKHLLDSSRKHRVIPFIEKCSTPNYPRCQSHPDKQGESHCEKCGLPVCSTCVASGKHRGHDISDIQKELSAKTQGLRTDLEELETRIYPRYQKIVSDVQTEEVELETKYGKLTTVADQQGDALLLEIIAIVNKRKSVIAEMKTKHRAALSKNKDEITHSITELKQIILNLKTILESNDVSLIYTYKSRNAEFRRLPPKVQVTLPSLSPQKINTKQLREMFGSLLPLSINPEERGYIMRSVEAVSSPPVKPLLDEPRVTATIDTGYEYLYIYTVSCVSEEQFWTRRSNEIMKLLNLRGKLLTSIQTKSGDWPGDIAVTRDGDLVYTDPDDNTMNLVKNKKIQTVITLQGWRPLGVCSTSSDRLLVTMISDDRKQSKVVRYSGSTETQTIQFDDQGRPLYSSAYCISENRNLDICVADWGVGAVVVVNQSGKLRFRYTGHPSKTKQSFDPYCITTDSQSHILTADYENHRIHILDQDGQFLRYIHCNLELPFGLCVNIKDNLFVAEWVTAKVKKIQYLSTQC
ncbi:E3 ubiquitin-protein ligase TRIM71-like [Ostrea edulis]|uniref:E3 ubiquitin-protein ligase TRIM71-like n=1 Tax=Ostrea edulis TaxID=37623 RepID=UPI0024AED0F4|nr:E3 ubiquitin-protein ligase TRIM71-like [Ostrea edulis]XP_056005834.1 E3 ubiquitin-protein ligase TRIM71-like [Ostrea edulis]